MPDKAIVSVSGLVKHRLIGPQRSDELTEVEKQFSVRLTPHVVEQIGEDLVNDPIALQYILKPDELNVAPHEITDPIGDTIHEKTKGLIHRYQDRVLLKPTATCQVYCRFCFRREVVGKAEAMLDQTELAAALSYINAHTEIREVILSGGDPLVLSDRRLGELMCALGEISHVEIIRIHTRVPIADPHRITKRLLAALGVGKPVFVVVHVNHANEISAAVSEALARMVGGGIPVLSQSVLLKGINNSVETLADLFRKLVANRVKPYYLHHLDRARGTSHFRCTIAEGQSLMRQLRGQLSGLCLPSFMLDIPGGFGKVPIGPNYLEQLDQTRWRVEDPNGLQHTYVDEA